ncbi:endonuclease III [Algimonas porphyrae]|uniref:Endonuclease III n=2 Tax=Algimonas porphyrae TaxID=1128113 RepID=A0ABQ5V3Y5_9PROT|nr:endonuclease III [Algimonas porphyrae]
MEGGTDRLRRIDASLRGHFPGFPPRYLILDPVSQLVMSLLGGQTRSDVSRAAHLALWSRYGGCWSAVRNAGPDAIHALISDVTYADRKALYMVDILTRITGPSGRPDLGHLTAMSVAEAHAYLEGLKGVGPKIAAAVLNTSTLRKRSLVIDTHHRRILQRLGFLEAGTSFPKAYREIMPLLPPEWDPAWIDVHHMLFKRLGQLICRPHAGHCHRCPLQWDCPAFQ